MAIAIILRMLRENNRSPSFVHLFSIARKVVNKASILISGNDCS